VSLPLAILMAKAVSISKRSFVKVKVTLVKMFL
jgi:hypothetical protein